MKSASFAIWLILLVVSPYALAENLQSQKFPFPSVQVPDTIWQPLLKFLLKVEHWDSTSRAPAVIYNLAQPKDYKFKDGIYTFRLFGPDFQPRLFIYRKGKLTMFEHYHTEGLLEEFLDFIKSMPDMSQEEKVKYLEYVSDFLKSWIKREGKASSID